jgi:hypothetical protein
MLLQREMGLKSSKVYGASFFEIRAINVALRGGCINPFIQDSSTT